MTVKELPLFATWRNWQMRRTQNPEIKRSCGFGPLCRQPALAFFPTCRLQNGNHSQNWTHHLFFMTNPARAISASIPGRTRIIESVKPDSKARFGSDLVDFRRAGAA